MQAFLNLLPYIPSTDVALFCGILGLFLGSFYNVCSDRYLSEESILWPPSHCTACNAKLSPLELIPLLSWLVLRGHCRHCGAVIGWRYPLMELASGFFAALVGYRFGASAACLVGLVFTGLFLVLSAIDFQAFLLPDKMTFPGAILAVPAAVYGRRIAFLASRALLSLAYGERRPGVRGRKTDGRVGLFMRSRVSSHDSSHCRHHGAFGVCRTLHQTRRHRGRHRGYDAFRPLPLLRGLGEFGLW